ncbi:hypothetical protein [Mycolicibacterium pyrenivorans]|uniref:hypothetical protein n=1 Tax=Mycolicibacterium pyrenivorans TaxID=187102 RepID=UPI0021F36F8A|nr:hypothetical protein [Mycolicibacterium pyrenivorans]MCV7150120.1 hypothetical protein [Mycolicibacterium pyrenivorans]
MTGAVYHCPAPSARTGDEGRSTDGGRLLVPADDGNNPQTRTGGSIHGRPFDTPTPVHGGVGNRKTNRINV